MAQSAEEHRDEDAGQLAL